jgi:RecA-family ATPase
VNGFPPWANLLDWGKVLTDTEEKDIEWLAFPFIEAGTVSSVFCDPKDGKSLVMQMICKQIALGDPVLGSPAEAPRPVLYLDYENPDRIIGERFLDMGAQADELGKHLISSNFPAMKPLDTPEGATMLGELANAIQAAYGQLPALTVIDTLSKTFSGAENSADTFSDLYRFSLMPMRQARMTVLYLDHSGKDPRNSRARAARGTQGN